jgi:hypothetical protein
METEPNALFEHFYIFITKIYLLVYFKTLEKENMHFACLLSVGFIIHVDSSYCKVHNALIWADTKFVKAKHVAGKLRTKLLTFEQSPAQSDP